MAEWLFCIIFFLFEHNRNTMAEVEVKKEGTQSDNSSLNEKQPTSSAQETPLSSLDVGGEAAAIANKAKLFLESKELLDEGPLKLSVHPILGIEGKYSKSFGAKGHLQANAEITWSDRSAVLQYKAGDKTIKGYATISEDKSYQCDEQHGVSIEHHNDQSTTALSLDHCDGDKELRLSKEKPLSITGVTSETYIALDLNSDKVSVGAGLTVLDSIEGGVELKDGENPKLYLQIKKRF